MVVSFKVSKTGTRFRPKPKPIPVPLQPSQDNQSQSDVVKAGENIDRTLNSSEKLSAIGKEASFTLNLYPDGYSIGKPCKYDAANQSLPKSLLPYDRSSEALFSAIESGHLPGDILDDIPAKYVDGALICEVRDYRRCSSKKQAGIVSVESSPSVNKVCLKMSLENIVKDIPSFTDKSWTYGDIMEVESNIVKALQPNLHLDPTPKLDRLCESRLPTKLNLQRKRLRNIPEFAVTSSNNIHGKKVYIDRVQENTKSRLNDSRITTSNAIVKQTLKNSAVQNLNPSIAKRSKKNIPSLTDKSQTYGDTLEVESKIPKALQPNLHLGPTPKLDQLCESRLPTQLNLQRKQLRIIPDLAVTSSNKIPGKNECIDSMQENSDSRFGELRITTSNAIVKQTLENPVMENLNPSIAMGSKNIVPYSSIPGVSMMSHQSKYPMVVGTPRSLQEHGSISGINSSGASAVQDAMHSYADNPNASVSLHVKRENPDRQSPPLLNISKRMRSASTGVDAMQQIGSHGDALQGSDMNWQDRLLQQQAMSRGIQYIGGGIQKFPQQVFDGGLNQETGAIQFSSGQQGMRLVDKVEQFEMERKDGARINRIKSEFEMYARNLWLQQRMPQHASMRPNFPQKEAKKEDQLQKRKQIQSPRLSSGTLPHSLLSSKSGEFSNGSVGPSFGPSSVNNASGALQKEKAAMASRTAAVGTPSSTYIPNDSTQRQQQAHLAAKRGSNSFPKTPSMSGVASPDSVFTDVLFNANSPSVGTSAFSKQGLQNMFERFSKIDMVTTRHKLHSKMKNPDPPIEKQNTYAPQHVAFHLANATNNEGLIDESSSLSKSLIVGSMNECKMRVLSFIWNERVVKGHVVNLVPRFRTRMMMAERPSGGTVAWHYGNIDESDFKGAEEYLPTLSNSPFADLLADQYSSQIEREGYVKEDDRIQLRPNLVNLPLEQYGGPIPEGPWALQMSQEFLSCVLIENPQALHMSEILSGVSVENPRDLQMSQSFFSGVSMAQRPHRLDSQQQAVQQQHQLQQNQHSLLQQPNPPFQRSLLSANQLSHLNRVGQNSNMH